MCGEAEETVEHFLLQCPVYAHERWLLEKAIEEKPDLKILLGNPKYTLALKNYLEATSRMEHNRLSE